MAAPARQFLDFEQPIKELYDQIEENQKLALKTGKKNYKAIIHELEQNILQKRKEITENLTPWQKV
ncbi:MAG: acetyl-CoA carboxylase carboxyl transferase subunit alpha, partial [Ginsengibacter sp.]